MLPAASRLTGSSEFGAVVRTGRRSGSRTVTVHLAVVEAGPGPRVGFVVSRGVGNAVTRNRVRRRLRHLCRELLPGLPAGSRLVVRASPAAASAPAGELRADLVRCLQRVMA